jgi:hypothetical protein
VVRLKGASSDGTIFRAKSLSKSRKENFNEIAKKNIQLSEEIEKLQGKISELEIQYLE